MALHFISDLHLDEQRPDTSRAFFSYLDHLPADTEALYILGDFFEVWVGDDDDLPFHRQIQQKLKEKTSSGLAIYLMHGNRDFLIGQCFAMHTGILLLPEPFVLEYHGNCYLLMHGDTLCTADTEYQQFRASLRSTTMQAELLKKPLAERRMIAKQLRMQSQSANSNKAETIMDVTPDEVIRVMLEQQCQTLIHGHTHRPATHALSIHGQQATRLVLGDWDLQGWEAVLRHEPTGNKLTLTPFPLHA